MRLSAALPSFLASIGGCACNMHQGLVNRITHVSVAVAATDADDTLASFSNWGKKTVHLAAPGTMVLNAWNADDANYKAASGTSMATPLVAGAAALLWSAKPAATYAQIK